MHDRPQRSWWGRHWKWAAPGGCLLLVLLAIGSCAALFGGILGVMKSSGAYGQGVERAQQHPAAIAALGAPITAGWMLQGQFNDSGDSGNANYTLPLTGPKGAGTLHVRAVKLEGVWYFRRLELRPEGGDRIELLSPEEIAVAKGLEARSGALEADDDDLPAVEAEDGGDRI
ncbi:cytochrome c oxidase assembly factor Coa1 family protein [Arenimonas composti]|uniref:Cytochrome oxidase complex assembly protein 1 n=1 Tax=Arenimonas composti TR7-09 = DSM 18010 TaxID=1121013 RepID=A0A091BKI6_9GAMM|nr:cytochrome c oxidase assembly factor Coa1 family protein [Arenimonas composti]KFN51314.1 hypothetical protein P873_03340 [Arenimonas composti TR7-09 = DSM 18010]